MNRSKKNSLSMNQSNSNPSNIHKWNRKAFDRRQLIGKITAIGMCAVICLSTTAAAFAKESTPHTEQEEKLKENGQTTNEEAGSDVQKASGKNKAQKKEEAEEVILKDETVYVLADTDGTAQKIIVSDFLQNTLASDEIIDRSELSGIENVKGDEKYTADGEKTIWSAEGNDIYYQGTIEKELPVEVSVTYQLDGQKMTAQEIAGKSGKVIIRFDYESKEYEMAEIDGKEEKVYVPFTMLTGMILDNDQFRNIEVTNGKLMNDGDRSVVVGLAFVGLQKNSASDSGIIEIPEYVEISADVTDFETQMAISVATNEIFSEMDLEGADLLSGMEGLTSLRSEVSRLEAGIGELSAGLDTLSANSAGLNAGAAQVFDALLSSANTQLEAAGISVPPLTVSNYAEVLNGVLASLNQAVQALQANSEGTAVPDAVSAQLAAAKGGIQAVTALKASLDSYYSFYNGLCSYTGGVDSAAAGAGELFEGVKSGTEQIETLVSALCGEMGTEDGVAAVKGKLGSSITGLQAAAEASRNYNNFSGIGDEMEGKVTFIYRIEGVKESK